MSRAWGSMLARHSASDRLEREPRDLGGHRAGVDLAQVEQVAEQVEDVADRVADRPEALLDLGVGVAVEVHLQQLRGEDDGVQRGPGVVRQGRDQPGLVPRRLLGQLPLLLERRLQLDPLGDVQARAEVAEERPPVVVVGVAPVGDPAVLAVVAEEPVRQLERLAAVEGVAEGRSGTRSAVVGVDALGPAVAELVARRSGRGSRARSG